MRINTTTTSTETKPNPLPSSTPQVGVSEDEQALQDFLDVVGQLKDEDKDETRKDKTSKVEPRVDSLSQSQEQSPTSLKESKPSLLKDEKDKKETKETKTLVVATPKKRSNPIERFISDDIFKGQLSTDFLRYFNLKNDLEDKLKNPELQTHLQQIRDALISSGKQVLASVLPIAPGSSKSAYRLAAMRDQITKEATEAVEAQFVTHIMVVYGKHPRRKVGAAKGAKSGPRPRYRFQTVDADYEPITEEERKALPEPTKEQAAQIEALAKLDDDGRIKQINVDINKFDKQDKQKLAETETLRRYEIERAKIEAQEAEEERLKQEQEKKSSPGYDVAEEIKIAEFLDAFSKKQKPTERYEALRFLITNNVELQEFLVKQDKTATELQKYQSKKQRFDEKTNPFITDVFGYMTFFLTLNPTTLGTDFGDINMFGDAQKIGKDCLSVVLGYLGYDKEVIVQAFRPEFQEPIRQWLSEVNKETQQLVVTGREKIQTSGEIEKIRAELQSLIDIDAKELAEKNEAELKMLLNLTTKEKDLWRKNRKDKKARMTIERRYLNAKDDPTLSEQIIAVDQMTVWGWATKHVSWSDFEKMILGGLAYLPNGRPNPFPIDASGCIFPGILSTNDLMKMQHLFQKGFIVCWSGGMAAPTILLRVQPEPEIFYPDNKEGLEKEIKKWMDSREVNSVAFFYSQEAKCWEAVLAILTDEGLEAGSQSQKKSVVRVKIEASSPFYAELQKIHAKNYQGYNVTELTHLMKDNQLFPGRVIGAQWLRYAIAFGASFEEYLKFCDRMSHSVHVWKWDIRVEKPSDAKVLEKAVADFSKNGKLNTVLFIQNPKDQTWEACLKTEKSIERVNVNKHAGAEYLLTGLNSISKVPASFIENHLLNTGLIKLQREGKPLFKSYQKMLKDTEVKEQVIGQTVRTLDEETKQMVNTQLNDMVPIATAFVVPDDAAILLDQNQYEAYFDAVLMKLKNKSGLSSVVDSDKYVAYNQHTLEDSQAAIYHSGDRYLTTQRTKFEMRQFVTILPNKANKQKAHILLVATSWSGQIDEKERSARVYLATPDAKQRDSLISASKNMAAGGQGQLLNEDIVRIFDKLTHGAKPINVVPSVKPFAGTGAWGILLGSLYFSEQHKCWFYINWNFPLPIKTKASVSEMAKFTEFAEKVLEGYLQQPDVVAYLDVVAKKGSPKPAPQLPKPIATLQSREAIDAAIKLIKDPFNPELQKEYDRLYNLIKDVVPMVDLVGLIKADKSDKSDDTADQTQSPLSPSKGKDKDTSKLMALSEEVDEQEEKEFKAVEKKDKQKHAESDDKSSESSESSKSSAKSPSFGKASGSVFSSIKNVLGFGRSRSEDKDSATEETDSETTAARLL